MANLDVLSFSAICSLLNKLETLHARYYAPGTNNFTKPEFGKRQRSLVSQWTEFYNPIILKDSQAALAVLSLLFPHLRTDRVYVMKEHVLAGVIARALGMGNEGVNRLRKWRLNDGDFGVALERTMTRRNTGVKDGELSAILVNQRLDQLSRRVELEEISDQILRQLLEKCTPSQGKWLARIILKTFPLDLVPRYHTFTAIHPSLWNLWQMNSDLTALSNLILDADSSETIIPQVGVPIQIPSCFKAQGCRHACVSLARHAKSCYVETKYDGHRMQIHVDLTLPLNQQVKIFNKSRKNGTKDREEIIPTIRKALGIGRDQKFRERCILDAELVLWDRDEEKILEFHELSSYVFNNKRYPDRHVNLMAIFFDILLFDEHVLVHETYRDRTNLLSKLISPQPGRAILAHRFHLLLHPLESAINSLRYAFSHAIARRDEGFVLKPANSPYIERHNWIKLKKDYIPGLGDNIDFCLIGAGHDATKRPHHGTKWNVWHVGCLENKHDVIERNARPRFVVLFVATYRLTKDDALLLTCRTTSIKGQSGEIDAGTFDIVSTAPGVPDIDAILSTPVLVELTGGGFDILKGTRDYVLRWPRFTKLHLDRDWKEGVSRDELQRIAKNALSMAGDGERERWEDALGVIDRIHAADGTVVPSSRLGEKAREELSTGEDNWCYGVELKSGLNIDDLLKKGMELRRAREMKRKAMNDPGITNKRICLEIKNISTANKSGHTLEVDMQNSEAKNLQQLLGSATILLATKAHWEEISQLIPSATYFDVTKNDVDKENSFPSPEQKSDEFIVLVDRQHGTSVRNVLGMVRQASTSGGRWHVYNWKIIRYIKRDSNVDWKNEYLWTYIDGNPY